MDFNKGNWNLNEALDFDLDKVGDLLDDKSSNRIVDNLRKHMGPEGFPKASGLAPGIACVPDYAGYEYKPKREILSRGGSKDKRKHWDIPPKASAIPTG